jgi:hypothetical protein
MEVPMVLLTGLPVLQTAKFHKKRRIAPIFYLETEVSILCSYAKHFEVSFGVLVW